jgi:kinesin family protein 15
MQRSFEYIFEQVETAKKKAEASGDHFEFLIRFSYLEIYNEQIMDLLDPSQVNLHVREDIKKGVYVEGLQEEVVQSSNDMIQLIQIGAKNRHVGSTSMNKESSRSHSVLTTIIETKSMKEGGVWNIKTSRFHIIDLAGSERSKYTNAVGERLKEAGMINKSLSALGNVINSLVDISEGKSRHVHYRDSKLTFLLRDSLGGNSKTLIVANISPSSICYGETLSTLKFAQRAKLIRNKAVINEDSSGTIQLLKSEISRLKKELAESEKRSKNLTGGTNNI